LAGKVTAGPGWARKQWNPRPELETADGSLFGGYLAALADQVLAFTTMTVVPHDRLYRTVNLQVNFLRVGRSHPLVLEGRVVAQTRQLITVRADFRREDGVLIADATAQQVLMAFDLWPAEQAGIEAMAMKPEPNAQVGRCGRQGLRWVDCGR
jgi:uncharacterized protein (TIGR00369 family)